MRVLLFISFAFLAVPLCAQEIDKEFTRLAFNEEFATVNNLWQQTNNGEDLFIVQSDKYLMQRKNKQNPALILSSQPEKFSSFRFDAVFNFEKNANKNQSCGIILMAQENGTGALIIEVSQRKELRILKYTANTFRNLITGAGEGWVKTMSLKPEEENTLRVVSSDRLYDIYINDVFIRSFTELEYPKGQIGLYIGPDSRAAFNSLKVYTEEDAIVRQTEKEIENMGKTDKALTEIIVQLKTQINNQKKEIASLNKQLETARQKNFTDSTKKAATDNLKKEVTTLSATNKRLVTENDTLKKENARLRTFQQNIRKADNGDMVIRLGELLQTEQENGKKLAARNKEIEEKNKVLEADKKRLEAELAKLKAEKPKSPEKPKTPKK